MRPIRYVPPTGSPLFKLCSPKVSIDGYQVSVGDRVTFQQAAAGEMYMQADGTVYVYTGAGWSQLRAPRRRP